MHIPNSWGPCCEDEAASMLFPLPPPVTTDSLAVTMTATWGEDDKHALRTDSTEYTYLSTTVSRMSPLSSCCLAVMNSNKICILRVRQPRIRKRIRVRVSCLRVFCLYLCPTSCICWQALAAITESNVVRFFSLVRRSRGMMVGVFLSHTTTHLRVLRGDL